MRIWGIALLSLMLVAGSEEHWLGLRSGAAAAEAKEDYGEALKLWRAAVVAAGSNEIRLRSSEAGLGRTLALMAVYVEAIPHLERAAGLFRTSKPPDDGGRLLNLERLATSLVEARRREDAVKPLTEAVEVAARLHGERSWEAGRILWSLGAVQLQRGEYATAERLLRKACTIAKESCGKDPRRAVPLLRDFGKVLSVLGRCEDLLATGIALEKLAEGSPSVLAAGLQFQGHALSRLGRRSEAESVYRRLLKVARKTKDDEVMARAHAGLAFVLRHAGKYVEAEINYRAALRIRARISGRASVYLAGLWVGIGRIRLAQERHDEAEDYVRRGLAIWQKAKRTNSRWLLSTLETLAEIVEARGRSKEAKRIRDRIGALKRKQGRKEGD